MKKIIAILLVAMCVLSFAGCGGAKTVNLTECMDKINSTYSVSDMKQLTTTDDLKKYYSIDAANVKSFAAEISNSGKDEIVLVEATDAAAAGKVKECLQKRYDDKTKDSASYDAEYLEIIKKCEVTTKDNYVRMIISKDAAGMVDVFNSYFA